MTYHFSDELIEEIRESNDIVEVISEYLSLKRTGSNYKALCPFHSEKTPSFVVSPSKQIFHCFGCGEGGDVINFVMKYENLNFIEALKLLADRVGIEIENKAYKKDSKKEERRRKLFEINRITARYFYYNLMKNKKAYTYLRKRGLSTDTIKKFGLGYSNPNWDDLLNYLKNKGFSVKDIEEIGLVIERKSKTGYYDRFRDRVMFPIVNTKGNVIGFGGRVLDDSQPKYLNSPDSLIFSKGYNLYGLNIAKKHSRGKKIILVEGYMDVISLYNHGIKCCVASLGTAFTPEQAKLIKRYGNDFFICYDSDTAGLNAADKALDILKNAGVEAKVIILPKGKDPDEFIKEKGKEAFEKLIDEALSYIDYKIYLNKKKFNLDTVEGKIDFTKEIASIIKEANSPIEADVYINKVSRETGISIDAIKKEIYKNQANFKTKKADKYRKYNYRNNNKDRINPVKYMLEPGHLNAEKNLLNLIINDKTIFKKINSYFTPDDFSDEVHKKLANIIYNKYKSNIENIDASEILNLFTEKEKSKVKEVFDLENDFKQNEKAIKDFINRIQYYKLKLKRDEIKKQISLLESKKEKSKGEVEKFKQLCLELIKIDKELKLH
ncbi:DNA primase [Thermohalobacter berrensis]|uniref:DNA primase n=1 Tax=Thermohalobacter berrensis TaxID=99594 RepID=A0A419TB70_9FIRM|nr:DNA primase [Thermohalobacter berrensis]RKD34720.1 DNA primase [Thermohalobacter berrensis]